MAALLSIGEFSRLTHVSVKALRHYHDLDLLCPAQIDPGSGYRSYATAQAPTAQLIRRFRDLGMPLDQIKVVLTAADPAARDEAIAHHLRSMERQLEQTKTAVASLRLLLEDAGSSSSEVAFHTLTDTSALLVKETVAWGAEIGDWLRDTFADLRRELGSDADLRGGPDGALYSAEFFESHVGEVTAFIPLKASAGRTAGRLPGGPVAMAVHRGSFNELDRTYTALGSFVAERGLSSPTRTAIQENYLVSLNETDNEQGLVTEVCWPVLATRGNGKS